MSREREREKGETDGHGDTGDGIQRGLGGALALGGGLVGGGEVDGGLDDGGPGKGGKLWSSVGMGKRNDWEDEHGKREKM